jgi:hypothetical protein
MRSFLTKYFVGNKIEKNAIVLSCGTHGGSEGVRKVFMGKPKGKRRLRRPKSSWDGNINMDHQELECGCWDRIELAQDRGRWRTLVSTAMNCRVP